VTAADRGRWHEPDLSDGKSHASVSVHDRSGLHSRPPGPGAPEASCSRAQEPARPGLVLGPARSL